MFEVKVDGKSYWVIENDSPAAFKDLPVWCSDKWYNPPAGKIKNLKIQTKGNII